jgi:hypothetical protein
MESRGRHCFCLFECVMRCLQSTAVAFVAACFLPSVSAAQTSNGAQATPTAKPPVAAAVPQAGPSSTPVPSSAPVMPGAEPLPSPADLMARIHLLEKRLADVEDRKRGAAKTKAAPAQVAKEPSGIVTPITPAPSKAPSIPSSTPSPAVPVTTVAKTAAAAAPPSDSSLQSSFLFRDTAPTLATNKGEISVDGSYVRNVRAGGSPFTQSDRLFFGAIEAKFGIGNGFEIGASASYFTSERQTRGALNVLEDVQGMGDVRFNVSRQLWAPTARLPGMALSVGVETPTGLTRYGDINRVVAIQEAAPINPLNPNALDPRDQSPFTPFLPSIASRGHWAVSANAQFFKTFDPVVVFFGVGVNHAFAREFEGNTFQPGLRLTYNAGLSLALSEHTTLGFQYSGSVDQRFKYTIRRYSDGSVRSFIDPSQETARARFVVIQRLDDGLFMEPSVTMGLTDDTPDLTVGLAIRKRM